MANILKQGKIYKTYFPKAYMVIDALRIDKKLKRVTIPLFVYPDKETRDDNKNDVPDAKAIDILQEEIQNHVEIEEQEINGEKVDVDVGAKDYDTYFALDVLKLVGNDPYKKAYQFVLSLPEHSQFKSDEA